MSLRRVPIHRSVVRPHLFLGGDREMVLFTALIAITLIVPTFNLMAILLGISVWFVALFLLRLLAKSDTQMRHVYLRHRKYQRFYGARSTPFRDS